MRKYLLNFSVLGALFGVVGVIRSTRNGPRDWRVVLMWAGWAISLALAIAAVKEEDDDLELREAEK